MKMNIKSNLIIGSFAMLGLFASCGPNSDDTDFTINDKVMVSAPGPNTFTIQRGQDAVTIPLVLEQAIDKKADFKLEIISGGGVDGDIDAGFGLIPGEFGSDFPAIAVEIPAYTKEYDLILTGLNNFVEGGTRNLTLKLTAAGLRTALTPPEGLIFNVTLLPSDELALILDWSGTVTYEFLNDDDEVEIEEDDEFCSITDLDLIANASTYLAGTADCPEMVENGGVLADGTYDLFVDMFNFTPEETPIEPFDIPFTLTISKPGLFVASVSYDDVLSSDHPVSAPGGNGAGRELAATLVVEGGKYTLFDRDGALVNAE